MLLALWSLEMGGKFQEMVLRRLRPHLEVQGSNREGFTLTRRTAPAPGGGDFESWLRRPAELVCRYRQGDPEAAPLELFGDATLSIHRWLGSSQMDVFVAEMLLLLSGWAWEEQRYRISRQPGTARGWARLMARCGGGATLGRVFPRHPGKLRSYVTLMDDGNAMIIALEARHLMLPCFRTS